MVKRKKPCTCYAGFFIVLGTGVEHFDFDFSYLSSKTCIFSPNTTEIGDYN